MQISFPWTCQNVGDFGPLTVEILEHTTRFLGNLHFEDEGVVYWISAIPFPGFVNASDGLLEVVSAGGNLLNVSSGVGLVKGWGYISDDPIQFNVAGGNAGATDIIGLRLTIGSQTVRPFLGRGAAGSTYALTQNTNVWEIPLATVLLDGSGDYVSHADARRFVRHAVAPSETYEYIDSTFGYNTTDSTVITPADAVYNGIPVASVVLPVDKVAYATAKWTNKPGIIPGAFTLPSVGNFLSVDLRAIIGNTNGLATGNMRYSLGVMETGTTPAHPPQVVGTLTQAIPVLTGVTTTEWYNVLSPAAPLNLVMDFVDLSLAVFYFARQGTDVLDTYPDGITVFGFQIRYNLRDVQPNKTYVEYIPSVV